jgi:cytochrome c biogenesis protein CcmG/thiol:disulfide interchange protein DsbE
MQHRCRRHLTHSDFAAQSPSVLSIVQAKLLPGKRLTRRLKHYALICVWLSCTVAHAADPIDLQAFRGRVVYLDFWASWCVPCRQSFPWMQTLKAKYQRQGLEVIAVNLDQNRGDADRFLGKFRPTFEVRFDPRGESAERFRVQGMPTSVIIDRHGAVRFTHIGFRPVDETAHENELRQVLAEE